MSQLINLLTIYKQKTIWVSLDLPWQVTPYFFYRALIGHKPGQISEDKSRRGITFYNEMFADL